MILQLFVLTAVLIILQLFVLTVNSWISAEIRHWLHMLEAQGSTAPETHLSLFVFFIEF